MLRFALKFLIRYVLTSVLATALLWYVASGRLVEQIRPDTLERTARSKAETVDDDASSILDSVQQAASSVLSAVWHAVRVPLAVLALAAVTLVILRMCQRHRRTMGTYRLLPYRTDEGNPVRIKGLFDALGSITLRRWWKRMLHGAESVAFDSITVRGSSGLMPRLYVRCPEWVAEDIDRALRNVFPHIRLIPVPAGERPLLPEAAAIVLKKRRKFTLRLQPEHDIDDTLVLDDVLAAQVAAGTPTTVQFLITRTPQSFDRVARYLYREDEKDLEARRVSSAGRDPGMRGGLAERERAGALATQYAAHFFVAVRILGGDPRACERVAAALRATFAENSMVERRIRIRRRLLIGRARRALPNPIPSWWKGVLSSVEAAVLWPVLPSVHVRSFDLERSAIPRDTAPPEVLRPKRGGILRDATGMIGIRPRDWEGNLLMIGPQGCGKSSIMARCAVEAIRGAHNQNPDRPSCVVVRDPKTDTAKAVAAAIPKDFSERTGRRVLYLDFSAPWWGFSPLSIDAEPALVGDLIVNAVRDINVEGAVQQSSDRMLRDATELCYAHFKDHEQPASAWDMSRLLNPGDASDRVREELSAAQFHRPDLQEPVEFFSRHYPQLKQEAGSQWAMRAEPSLNKLQALKRHAVDRILRHPFQIDLEECIRRGDVILIDGAAGTIGTDNCRVLMQMFSGCLHAALLRQAELPPSERNEVFDHVDEAHLVLSSSYAEAMAVDRAFGLRVCLGMQYTQQIEDPKIQAGLAALCRSAIYFGVSGEDAEMATKALAPLYSSQVRDDASTRERMQVTPDMLTALPVHFCKVSLVAQGARVAHFTGETVPLQFDQDVVDHHIREQAKFGAHLIVDPPLGFRTDSEGTLTIGDDIAGATAANADADVANLEAHYASEAAPEPQLEDSPPATPVDVNGAPPDHQDAAPDQGAPDAAGMAATGSSREDTARPVADGAPDDRVGDRAARPTDAGGRTETVDEITDDDAPLRASGMPRRDWRGDATLPGTPPPSGPPESFMELQYPDPRRVRWDSFTIVKPEKVPKATKEEADAHPRASVASPLQLQILAELNRCRYLTSDQIHRKWFADKSKETSRKAMRDMASYGWVGRFEITPQEGGRGPRIYVLLKAGFDVAQKAIGPDGFYIPEGARFNEAGNSDARRILHDLHGVGWLHAFERMVDPKVWLGFRGPQQSHLQVPSIKPPRGPRRPVVEDDVNALLPAGYRIHDLHLGREEHLPYEALNPDFTVMLRLRNSGRRVDLFIEVDRTNKYRSEHQISKYRRYDALLTAWWRLHRRYERSDAQTSRGIGNPPIVIFVCTDQRAALNMAKAADEHFTGRIAQQGKPIEESLFVSRERVFFTTELDVHVGRFCAFRLAKYPPKLRDQIAMSGRELPRTPGVVPSIIDMHSLREVRRK